jgi:hypothetical protein
VKIDSEFLFEEIDKLQIDDWEKSSLKTLVLAELASKTANQFRELLETQMKRDDE